MRLFSRPNRHLRLADELVAAGKPLDAIALLTTVNKQARNDRIEQRLVQLRFQARSQLQPREGAPTQAEESPDLFDSALPEIDRDALSIELLSSAIQHHGCLLVRGLFNEDRAERLALDVERAFEAHDAAMAATTHVKPPWFVPFDAGEQLNAHLQRQWVRDGGGVLAVDSPPALFDVIDAFEEAGIRALVSDFLDDTPMLLAAKWTLRRILPEEFDAEHGEDLDFHQDGSFMGADIRSLNVWVSLSHCGVDAPGLDIALRRFHGIVKTGSDGATFDWTVTAEVAEQASESAIFTPRFAPGDALFFDHLLLHRTSIRPHMKRRRHAIEAWFAAPSAYPEAQVPIAF